MTASVKVPTTHDHPEGVAAGIVAGLERLLREHGLIGADGRVHRALDDAGHQRAARRRRRARRLIGRFGRAGWLARHQMRFDADAARAGHRRSTRPFGLRAAGDENDDRAGSSGASRRGAQAIAASEAFGVDRPAARGCVRRRVRARARLRCDQRQRGHSMYGLRARTRTAALNAAMLPRMLRTARMTRRAVARAAHSGAADDHAHRRRRDGRSRDRTPPDPHAAFGPGGGHRRRAVARKCHRRHLHRSRRHELRLLGDPARTPADAPGAHRRPSHDVAHARRAHARHRRRQLLAHVGGGAVVDVGPRSRAHRRIAYASFCDEATCSPARVSNASRRRRATPPTMRCCRARRPHRADADCAANVLGSVPDVAFARGNAARARLAFAALGAAARRRRRCARARDARIAARQRCARDRRADRRLRSRREPRRRSSAAAAARRRSFRSRRERSASRFASRATPK